MKDQLAALVSISTLLFIFFVSFEFWKLAEKTRNLTEVSIEEKKLSIELLKKDLEYERAR